MMYGKTNIKKTFLRELIVELTISSLSYEASDLLIFVDDTGVEKRSAEHPVFGLGGCALHGHAYDVIKPVWMKLRRDVFQLQDGAKFHATDVLPRLSVEQLALVTAFLARPQPRKFAAVVNRRSAINPGDELEVVNEGVMSTVSDLCGHEPFQRVYWIIEHSDRLSRAIVQAGPPHYYGAGEPKNIHFFMKASAKEPGLEISDLIVFITGRHFRQRLVNKSMYQDQINAAFSDPSVGRFDFTVATVGPVRTNASPNFDRFLN